jgi:hypothetical protein
MENEKFVRDDILQKYATYLLEENQKHLESLTKLFRDVEVSHRKSLEEAHNANREALHAYVDDIKACLAAAELENSTRFTHLINSNRIGAITTLVASGMGIETAIVNLEHIETANLEHIGIVVGEMSL